MLSYHNELVSTPDFYLCKAGRILDYMGITSLEQLVTIMTSEFLGTAPEEPILLVDARNLYDPGYFAASVGRGG